jgi:hypothetical protein
MPTAHAYGVVFLALEGWRKKEREKERKREREAGKQRC